MTEQIIEIFQQNITNAAGAALTEDSVIRKELDVDSLEMMLVVSEIENVFEIEISNEEIGKIITIRDAVDCVEKLLQKKAEA